MILFVVQMTISRICTGYRRNTKLLLTMRYRFRSPYKSRSSQPTPRDGGP